MSFAKTFSLNIFLNINLVSSSVSKTSDSLYFGKMLVFTCTLVLLHASVFEICHTSNKWTIIRKSSCVPTRGIPPAVWPIWVGVPALPNVQWKRYQFWIFWVVLEDTKSCLNKTIISQIVMAFKRHEARQRILAGHYWNPNMCEEMRGIFFLLRNIHTAY